MGLGAWLLDLLFPPKCAFCGKLTARRGDGVCPDCRSRLPFTPEGARLKADFLTAVVSPLYYEDDVRRSLLRYKFQGTTALARAYGPLLAETVRRELEGKFDTVSWVPLSRARERKRGFDQAKLLAQRTARELDLPLTPLLRKVRNALPQSGTGSAEKRRANISGCYAVPDAAAAAGRRVLLIDDIVTTGSTLSECARVLMLAGAAEVMGAALARSRE